MKRKLAILLFIFALVFSCSTDGEDNSASDDLVGMEDDVMMDDDSNDDSNNDDSSDDDSSSDDSSSDGDDSNDDSSDDDNSDDDTGTDDDMSEQIDILGLWVLTELRLDDGVNDFSLQLAEAIVDQLVELECDLLTFDFKDDGNVESGNRLNDLDLESSELTCPKNAEIVTLQWSLESDQLTLIDKDAGEETITIILEDENTLVIQGEDAIDEEFTGTEGVFVRQQTDS